jgi:hypothetical protein
MAYNYGNNQRTPCPTRALCANSRGISPVNLYRPET